MTRKVLTVTINHAVDVTTEVEALAPKKKLRCETPRFDPGGGGVNVARAIRTLGGDVCAFVVAGGESGRFLRDLCGAEGLDTVWFDIEGRTRELLKVRERGSGDIYRFMLPGPEIELCGNLGDAAIRRRAGSTSGSPRPRHGR